MDDLELFYLWNKVIFKTQDENGLVDLYHIDGSSSGSIYTEVLSKKKAVYPIHYTIFKLHDEFISISKNMKYVTGILYFLRPYIVDTSEMDGRYYQNLEDGRYLFYCTAAIGTVYNFWDRIGDLLHHYFPTNINSKKVYYEAVMTALRKQYGETESYQKLTELYERIKTIILGLRNKAIHHFQLENIHYWGNIEFLENEEERNKLNAEKFTFPERMKEAMEISNESFFVALKLINELPDDPEILRMRNGAKGSGK